MTERNSMVPDIVYEIAAEDGLPGSAIPTGGTSGQVLAKASDTDFDDEWVDQSGGSGDLSDAVVLAPGGSVRNVITPTGDVTGLTLQTSVGQTAPALQVHDPTFDADGLMVYANRNKTQVLLGAAIGQAQADALITVLDDTGSELFHLDQEPGGVGSTFQHSLGSGASYFQVFLDNGDSEDAILRFGLNFTDYTQLGPFLGAGDPIEIETSLKLRALARQVLPLLQLLSEGADSLGDASASVFRVFQTGHAISNAHAEPDDSLLNASDHVTWLDDTPGAVVLHFKAKDSAGTVVNGSLPLT